MDRLKRIAGSLFVMVAVSAFVSAVVFTFMRKDALDKMLEVQEMMVIQSLVADAGAVQNLTRARFQKAEEILYKSIGVNMGVLTNIYEKRRRLPDQTVASLIRNVAKYRESSELSLDKRFSHVFNKDTMEFMSRVEKAGEDGKLAN